MTDGPSDAWSTRIVTEACLVRLGYSLQDVREMDEDEILAHAVAQNTLNELIKDDREAAAWLARAFGG